MRIGAWGSTAAVKPAEHRIDRWVANIEHGRFERSLSGLTAFAAVVTTAEVYAEHYRASFGNKMMWSPIVVTPPVVIAGRPGSAAGAGPRPRYRRRRPSTCSTA